MRKIFLWILMTMMMYQLIVTPSWWPSQTIVMSSLTKARRCWWVSWMVLFFYRQTNQSTLHDKVAAWSTQKVKSVWKHFLYADQSNFLFTDRIRLTSFRKIDPLMQALIKARGYSNTWPTHVYGHPKLPNPLWRVSFPGASRAFYPKIQLYRNRLVWNVSFAPRGSRSISTSRNNTSLNPLSCKVLHILSEKRFTTFSTLSRLFEGRIMLFTA